MKLVFDHMQWDFLNRVKKWENKIRFALKFYFLFRLELSMIDFLQLLCQTTTKIIKYFIYLKQYNHTHTQYIDWHNLKSNMFLWKNAFEQKTTTNRFMWTHIINNICKSFQWHNWELNFNKLNIHKYIK